MEEKTSSDGSIGGKGGSVEGAQHALEEGLSLQVSLPRGEKREKLARSRVPKGKEMPTTGGKFVIEE